MHARAQKKLRSLNLLCVRTCALLTCMCICACSRSPCPARHSEARARAHTLARGHSNTRTHARTLVHTPVCSKPLWPDFSAYWWMSRLAAEAFLGGKGDLPGFRLPAAPGVRFCARARARHCAKTCLLFMCVRVKGVACMYSSSSGFACAQVRRAPCAVVRYTETYTHARIQPLTPSSRWGWYFNACMRICLGVCVQR